MKIIKRRGKWRLAKGLFNFPVKSPYYDKYTLRIEKKVFWFDTKEDAETHLKRFAYLISHKTILGKEIITTFDSDGNLVYKSEGIVYKNLNNAIAGNYEF